MNREGGRNTLKIVDFADKSLLIVDDDDPFRGRLARAMEKKGFQVTEANGIATGIASVKKSTPGFALIDLILNDGNGLDINNLPYFHNHTISVPLDILYLVTDDDYNFVTTDKDDVTINWDLSSVPVHVSISLTDNITGHIINIDLENEYNFSTYEKGSFPSYNTNGTGPGTYPQIGDPRFTITVYYNNISGDINADGLLNMLDIVEIIDLIMINEYNNNADINGDMELNVLDVIMIIDAILTN